MSAENFILIDFFAVKVDGSDVTQQSVKRFSYRQIPGLTSLPSTLTNVYEDEIFGRQILLQFFTGEFKDYKYVKFPVRCTLNINTSTTITPCPLHRHMVFHKIIHPRILSIAFNKYLKRFWHIFYTGSLNISVNVVLF